MCGAGVGRRAAQSRPPRPWQRCTDGSSTSSATAPPSAPWTWPLVQARPRPRRPILSAPVSHAQTPGPGAPLTPAARWQRRQPQVVVGPTGAEPRTRTRRRCSTTSTGRRLGARRACARRLASAASPSPTTRYDTPHPRRLRACWPWFPPDQVGQQRACQARHRAAAANPRASGGRGRRRAGRLRE